MAVLSCTCEHRAQDRLYGKGKRLFNERAADQKNSRSFRCTVCGRVEAGGQAQ